MFQINTAIASWLLPLAVSLIIAIGIYVGRRSTWLGRLLTGLRTLLWLALVFLLFDLQVDWQNREKRPARVGIWLDQSQSMPDTALTRLRRLLAPLDTVTFVFRDLNDGRIIPASSATRSAPYTRFESLQKGFPDVDRQWLISDGNVNFGRRDISPPAAQPLRVIAVGDTTRAADARIVAAEYPTAMRTGERDTVAVFVALPAAPEAGSIEVGLFRGKNRLAARAKRIRRSGEYRFALPLSFRQAGMQRLQLRLRDNQRETNEVYPLAINVLPQVTIIDIVYAFPMAELRYFRYFLAERPDLELRLLAGRQLDGELAPPGAAIFFGFPVAPLTAKQLAYGEQLRRRNIPVFFFTQAKTNPQAVRQLLRAIEISTDEAVLRPLEPADEGVNHPVSNPDLLAAGELENLFADFPPMAVDRRMRLADPARVLFTANGEQGRLPVLSLAQSGERKTGLANVWNSYLLHTSALALRRPNYWQQVNVALVDWLLTPIRSAGIYHNLPDTLWQADRAHILRLNVVNRLGDAVGNADVDFELRRDDWLYRSKVQTAGAGYSTALPALLPGDYQFTITAKQSNAMPLSATGQIHVPNQGLELAKRGRNLPFLRTLASDTLFAIESLRPEDFALAAVAEVNDYRFRLFPRPWMVIGILALFLLEITLRRFFHKL
jgi:hypothetical protein